MRRLPEKLRFVLGMLLAVVCSTTAAQTPTLQHLDCVADVYPPFTLERGGVVSGTVADLLVEAGKRVGLDIAIKLLPFARIDNEIKRGAASSVVCAYAFGRTPEREAYMLFGSVPVTITSYVLYAKAGKGPAVYTGVDALQGARIGVRLAFRLPDAIKQAAERGDITLETVNDDELNFRKLKLGRVDYVLINQDVGETIARRLQLADVRVLYPAVDEFPTFVVFNKGLENAVALRNAVDKGLQAVRATRAEQRIREQ